MSRPLKGDIKDSTPDWEPYAQPIAPEGTPNEVPTGHVVLSATFDVA